MSATMTILNRSTPRNRFSSWIKALCRRSETSHLAEKYAKLDFHTLQDMGLTRAQVMGF